MKTKNTFLQNSLFIFGLPLLLILSISILALNHQMANSPPMALAIILDLIITIPLVYWLLIRSTDIPKISIIPFITGGLILAGFILPESQQGLLQSIKFLVVPLIELGLVFYLLSLAKKTSRKFKSLNGSNADFLKVIRQSTQEAIPMKTFARFLSFEIAVFYYAFFQWSKATAIPGRQFSYHQKSGAAALFFALTMIVLIEAFAVHLLIEAYSPIFAWILTISSLYLGLQFYAHTKAIKRRFIEIDEAQIILRNGLFANTVLALDNIESIELSQRSPASDRIIKKLALLDELELHNIVIHLKQAIEIEGLYGQKKKAEVLLIWVDEKESFVQTIQSIQADSI